MPSELTNSFSTRRSWLAASAAASGADRPDRRQHLGRARRHVLELVGHDVDGLSEGGQLGLVLVGGDGLGAADVEGRAVGIGAVDVGAQAEPRGGDAEHAAELAAAENADRVAGAPACASQSTGAKATASVFARRQAASRCASASSCSASTAAASRAALIAPALPMASVPTGTPPGICTME